MNNRREFFRRVGAVTTLAAVGGTGVPAAVPPAAIAEERAHWVQLLQRAGDNLRADHALKRI